MAYAQHTIKTGGCLIEKEYGKIFEYSTDVAEHGWDNRFSSEEENKLAASCTHVVYVGPSFDYSVSTRLAIVKKTVAYVLVSDENDRAIFQKWYIKNHNEYNNV